MPPIVLTLLQALLLLLLYIFVARAVRAVVRDLRAARPAPARPAGPAPSGGPSGGATQSQPRAAPRPPAARGRGQRTAPRELVVHTADGRPRVLPLDGDEVTFGRADSSTVPLGDPYVSDRHARVYRDGSEWLVADLGSTNGTFLNQRKVTRPTPIAAGDQLGIGKTRVEVRR